jgi:hypothetical protein
MALRCSQPPGNRGRTALPESQEHKPFRRNSSDPNGGPSGKGMTRYRASKLTCQSRPSKEQCRPDTDFRSITRKENKDARQAALESPGPGNMSSRRNYGRKLRCGLPASNAFLAPEGSHGAIHATQLTNSFLQQSPRTFESQRRSSCTSPATKILRRNGCTCPAGR